LVACTGITDRGWATRNVTAWGDSLTDGQPFARTNSYPTKIATLFPDHIATNDGIGGETSTQILSRLLADTTHRHDVTVLLMGRNNLEDPARIRNDIAAAVNGLGSDRYVVLSILNGHFSGTEAEGALGYVTIVGINRSFLLRYSRNYPDIQVYQVSLYIPLTRKMFGITPATFRRARSGRT
jgi:lysophospholipase L1-like esterase